MNATSMEWARLAPEELLIATASHAWLEPLTPYNRRGIMLGAGSLENPATGLGAPRVAALTRLAARQRASR